jgi:hypothetical protein
VQSWFWFTCYDFARAFRVPILLLRGAFIDSENFIYFSERSTFKPRPIFEKAPNDFLLVILAEALSALIYY